MEPQLALSDSFTSLLTIVIGEYLRLEGTPRLCTVTNPFTALWYADRCLQSDLMANLQATAPIRCRTSPSTPARGWSTTARGCASRSTSTRPPAMRCTSPPRPAPAARSRANRCSLPALPAIPAVEPPNPAHAPVTAPGTCRRLPLPTASAPSIPLWPDPRTPRSLPRSLARSRPWRPLQGSLWRPRRATTTCWPPRPARPARACASRLRRTGRAAGHRRSTTCGPVTTTPPPARGASTVRDFLARFAPF